MKKKKKRKPLEGEKKYNKIEINNLANKVFKALIIIMLTDRKKRINSVGIVSRNWKIYKRINQI